MRLNKANAQQGFCVTLGRPYKLKRVSNKTDNFYNKFSVFYPLVDIFLKPQKRKLFEEINKLPFGQILEVGVGNGRHFQFYKTHKVIGIDTSSKMLGIAEKRKNKNIKLKLMNAEALLFKDQTFDYIILSHVIAVVDNPEKLLEESYRVLKPNGKIFILNHFTPKNWLRHLDICFQFFSKKLHFKSVFYIESFDAIKKFTFIARREKKLLFNSFILIDLLVYLFVLSNRKNSS
jgi:phosphatidylethanolamine/phosphatidyl-N-methylethanolamine N-methyltransferase